MPITTAVPYLHRSHAPLPLNKPSKPLATTVGLFRTIFIANLNGLIVGMHLALFSGILEMPDFVRAIGTRVGFFPMATVSPMTKSFVTAAYIISMAFAAPFCGPLIDIMGYRLSLLLISFLFIVSSLATIFTKSATYLIITRLVAGLAYAFSVITTPLYTAEISPPERRGAFVNIYQFMISVGIFSAQLCNIRFVNEKWTASVSLSVVPAVITLILVLTSVSESPVWQAARQKRLRSKSSTITVPFKGNDPRGTQSGGSTGTPNSKPSTLIGVLHDRSSRKRLAIGVGLSMAQQLCGISAVFFYAPAIFNDVLQWHGMDASLKAAAAVGCVNMVSCLAASFIIGMAGRRTLLLAGAPPMALCLIVIGAMRDGLISKQPLLGIGSVLAYVSVFGLTYGPVSLVVASEIFPPRCSGTCMSICIGALGLCSATVGMTFLLLLQTIGGGVFFIFAAFLALSSMFVWYIVPETKDLTLDEIEVLF